MAYDKVVDSQQLNADLTSVANAIRTRGGTSAHLAFPADFISAVQAIPAGGDVQNWLDGVEWFDGYINTSGALSTPTARAERTSDFIDITSSTGKIFLYAARVTAASPWLAIAWYNSSRAFISNSRTVQETGTNFSDGQRLVLLSNLITNTNAVYVRVSIRNDGATNSKVVMYDAGDLLSAGVSPL